MGNIRIVDHSDEVLRELNNSIQRGLEMVGTRAVDYAVLLCPKDTGHLSQSITHEVDENTVVVGTNTNYAVYVELGTGVFAENEDGRPTPWRYQDERGKWHYTVGQHPQPFIRPAINDHIDEYKDIIEEELKGT